MTEDEALKWVTGEWGDAARLKLEALVELIKGEATRQNLVSRETLSSMWSRHVADSAQLLRFADNDGPWIDVGTGAGFPGLVVAILSPREVTLVEPRRLRAEFLRMASSALGLTNVSVVQDRIERVRQPYEIISARAVASLVELFASAQGCATEHTRWILPKGRKAREELAEARRVWQGEFHVEQSITDPDAAIIVATSVRRR